MILLHFVLGMTLVLLLSGLSSSQDVQYLLTQRRDAILDLLVRSVHPQTLKAHLHGHHLEGGGHPSDRITQAERRRYARIKPIDEIIASAESRSRTVRERSKEYMAKRNLVLVEGDIMMSRAQLGQMDGHRVMDKLETLALKRFLRSKWYSNVTAKDEIVSKLLQQHQPVRQKRATTWSATTNSDWSWPNGLVPVLIEDDGFSSGHKREIADAMNHITQTSCVCFHPISKTQAPNSPHIRIINGNGCWSYLGRQSDHWQHLSLAPGCRVKRVAVHQFLHALGFHHEHQRPDRDGKLEVHRNNVIPEYRHWVDKSSWYTVDSWGIPYDYLSIMHYGKKAFSRNQKDTLKPTPEYNNIRYGIRIGRVGGMSKHDTFALNRMYGCASTPRNCAYYPYSFP